jgi:hypothetical protein
MYVCACVYVQTGLTVQCRTAKKERVSVCDSVCACVSNSESVCVCVHVLSIKHDLHIHYS